MVRKLLQVSRRAPGITTTINQLAILQAGKRKKGDGSRKLTKTSRAEHKQRTPVFLDEVVRVTVH